jgi:spore germination cell wall hydrolase CwlJ-like protein
MRFWRSAPAFLRTRLGLTLGAATLAVTMILAGGAALDLSRGPPARASVPTAVHAPMPALKPIAPLQAALQPVDPPILALRDMTPEQALAANQATPFSTLPNPAAKPFNLKQASEEDRDRAQTCLAQAVYYEAGFEPLAGEQAVAQVVLNRVRHPVYPKTVCGVVFQGSELKTGCQFTFTCDGALGRPPEPKAWARAQAVAQAALNGFVMKGVGEATHYHTQYVLPYWSPSLVKLAQIGQHIFYRWTGSFGQPPAFAGQYAGNEPGAATPAPIAPLLPMEKLAVDYSASPASQPAAATSMSSTPADPEPARQARAEASPAAPADPAPVVLAHADPAPVQAEPPKAVAVNKVFLPSESLVPRPRWKPF